MAETNVVASALELLGWTQDTLADALNHEEDDGKGVSAPTMWRWMTGRTAVPSSVKAFLRLQICATFGLDAVPGDTLSSVVERVKSRKDDLIDLTAMDEVIRNAFKLRADLAEQNRKAMRLEMVG